MVRWFRLFGNQYAGFWALGLLLFAVQEIPYILMPFIHLKTNPIMNMTETSPVLDVCEKILGSLCIALMIFIIHRRLFQHCRGQRKAVLHAGCRDPAGQLCRLGPVLCRPSEPVCHDGFHRRDAAAVLYGHRSMAAEHAAGDHRRCIPGRALPACAGESALISAKESYADRIGFLSV